MLHYVIGMLTQPRRQWVVLSKQKDDSIIEIFIRYLLLLALVPSVSLLVSTTTSGWILPGQGTVRLTVAAAVPLALTFYLLLLVGVVMMAYIMYGLESHFSVKANFERCLVFTIFTAFPLFLSGIAALYPSLWVGIALVIAAAGYSVYLLFIGLPVFLQLEQGKAVKFAILMIVAGMAALLGCGAILLLLWTGGLASLPS